MSSASATIELRTPGSALETSLLARFHHARMAGRRVWYLAPDARTRRRRVARLGPPAAGRVGTLRDLALRALRTAGESVVRGADPGVVEALLARRLDAGIRDLPSGPGRAAAARALLRGLLRAGWSGESVARELSRWEEGQPASAGAEALWRPLRELCPEVDAAEPLRRVLEAGLLEGVLPEVLLVEGGPLPEAAAARLLHDLVRRVRSRGGEVHACCLDLPVGAGPRGRMLRLLRESLAPER